MNIICKSESCMQELENWKKDRIKKHIITSIIWDIFISFFILVCSITFDDSEISYILYAWFDEEIIAFFITSFIFCLVISAIVDSYLINKSIIPEYNKFKAYCYVENLIVATEGIAGKCQNRNISLDFEEIKFVSSKYTYDINENSFPFNLLQITDINNNSYYFSSFSNSQELEICIQSNITPPETSKNDNNQSCDDTSNDNQYHATHSWRCAKCGNIISKIPCPICNDGPKCSPIPKRIHKDENGNFECPICNSKQNSDSIKCKYCNQIFINNQTDIPFWCGKCGKEGPFDENCPVCGSTLKIYNK